MSVKTKLIVLCLLLVLIFSIHFTVTRQQQEKDFQALFASQQKQLSVSLDRLIELDGNTLEFLTYDYAHRADLASYAQLGIPFEMQAVLQSAVSSHNIDSIWVYQVDHSQLFFASRFPDEWYQNQGLIPPDAFEPLFATGRQVHFFMLSPSGALLEIQGAAITPALEQAAAQTPPLTPNGYLFVGRRWNDEYLARLNMLVGASLSLVPGSSTPVPAEKAASFKLQKRFIGWDQQPLPVELQMHYSDPVYDAAIRMRDRDVLSYAATSVIFLLALLLMLYFWVARPMAQISRSLSEGKAEPVLGMQKWRDEFGFIARQIRRSFEQQAELDQEIVHRKDTEAALRASEDALRQEEAFTLAVLNTANSLILVLDNSGKIVRCNPACERILGYTSEQMRDRFFWELVRDAQKTKAVRAVFAEMVTQRAEIHQEIYLRLGGGQPCWISWSNSFMLNPDGQVHCVVISGVDITERKQRERQQEAIASLASELRGFLSLQQTNQLILEQVMHLMRTDLALVALVQPYSGQLRIEKAVGPAASNLAGQSLPADGISGKVFQSGQPCLSSDPAALGEGLEKLGHSAWIPLLAEGSPIGLLLVGSQQSISKNDFRLLVSLADITANAIHRCQLSGETQRRLQRLSALYTINLAVSASLDLRVTLNVLVNQITSQLGVDAADIFMIDPVTRDLYFVAGSGFRSPSSGFILHRVETGRLWIGQSRAGQVVLERKSMHLYNPQGIAGDFLPNRNLAEEDFTAYNAVPLMIKGEVRGVLETFHRAPYQPDAEWLQFLESLATETSIAINNAEMLEKLQKSNMDLALAYDATIEGWAQALEMRDEVTENHTRRVTDLTIRLAQLFDISGDDLKYIRYGALLHDIGKMGIPDEILKKPGKLSDDDWVIMRKHPEYAREMLASISFLKPAMVIPYCHHERWDGSGYPQGLAGKQIPLAARIFAVVDVWDALYCGRPYRQPLPEEEVLTYLQQEAGRLFDPEVVAAFVELRKMLNLNGGPILSK